MDKVSNQDRVVRLLCRPKGGKAYLLNALNSQSEQVFIEALHHVIDALDRDLAANLSKKL